MSIKPTFAEAILSKRKTVEIRRTRFNAQPGDIVLLYATKPKAQIVGWFVVERSCYLGTETIWQEYGAYTCLDADAYFNYAEKKDRMCAIVISEAKAVEGKKLSELGRKPPQSFIRIKAEEFILLCSTEKD